MRIELTYSVIMSLAKQVHPAHSVECLGEKFEEKRINILQEKGDISYFDF